MVSPVDTITDEQRLELAQKLACLQPDPLCFQSLVIQEHLRSPERVGFIDRVIIGVMFFTLEAQVQADGMHAGASQNAGHVQQVDRYCPIAYLDASLPGLRML